MDGAAGETRGGRQGSRAIAPAAFAPNLRGVPDEPSLISSQISLGSLRDKADPSTDPRLISIRTQAWGDRELGLSGQKSALLMQPNAA